MPTAPPSHETIRDLFGNFRVSRGTGRLVATAIHDGHEVRPAIADLIALSPLERLREEDPYTAGWVDVAPSTVVGIQSRFEVDLNRPRESAVYRTPEDAWGLDVWSHGLPEEVVEESLVHYDLFYQTMEDVLTELRDESGPFVVYDLHSYNHRRDGQGATPADPEANPEVNVGTGSLDRDRWGGVVDAFIQSMAAADYRERHLDVRENVRFRGGHFSQWVHETFPEDGCCLAIEVKKIFMDEWTGRLDLQLHREIGRCLGATVEPVLAALLPA